MSFDIIIVGAGPAGSGAAASLARLGKRILWVDAGHDRHKQLAGELLHPAGVEDVHALGLGAALDGLPHSTIQGFAVLEGVEGTKAEALLPYRAGETGIAADHAALVEALADTAQDIAGITFWPKARITELTQSATGVAATIKLASDEVRIVEASALVAADGRNSAVRRLLGIEESYHRLSTMLGITVPEAVLPHRGRGHIFTGGAAPVLAYDIGGGQARVMVDLPLGSSVKTLQADDTPLVGLPIALREAVKHALGTQPVRAASNDERIPQRVQAGLVVFVGDAAGCCHPISASGIASGLRDACELEAAVSASPDDLRAAFSRYSRRRRPAQRTRIALATALFRAFSDHGAGMTALRLGLFTYWLSTSDGTQRSMELLSTRDMRMWSMAREYSRVAGHGLWQFGKTPADLKTTARASFELLSEVAGHLKVAMQGVFQDVVRRG